MKRSKNISKIVLCICIFLGFFINKTHAQDWLSGWKDATVAIGVVRKADVIDSNTGIPKTTETGEKVKVPYFKAIGTGVICANPNTEDPSPYLLTAKHVFNDPDKGWQPKSVRIRFSWFDRYSVTENLGIKLNLSDKENNPLWIEHTDKKVDLAVFHLRFQSMRQKEKRFLL